MHMHFKSTVFYTFLQIYILHMENIVYYANLSFITLLTFTVRR